MRQPIDLLEHAAHRLFVFGRCTGLSQADLANPANHREWCAQLVRRIGGESAQLLE